MKKLFDVKKPSIVEIEGIKFHNFQLEDKEMFYEYYHSVGYESLVWEHTFAHLYSFAQTKEVYWKVVKGHLTIFVRNNNGRMVCYLDPISKNNEGDLKEAVLYITKILFKVNGDKKSCFEYITKRVFDETMSAEKLKENGGHIIKEYSDFIYKCSDIIGLEGKKYKARRSIINRFDRENPNKIVRLMTDDDIPSVLELRDIWETEYIRSDREIWDKEIFRIYLKLYKELDVRFFVLEINNKIEGYFSIAKLGKNCSVVVNENTNTNFVGISEYLWRESLRLSTDLGEYENDGNGGDNKSGLYFYKTSFNPIALIEKLDVDVNKTNEKPSLEFLK